MSLLSYAQNGEDIVLYRALKDVEAGHYIDIGAYDPGTDSVTKFFYDRGWSGINVEASRSCFERLAAERQRDRNLHAAASERAGVVRLLDIPATGLSTLDPDVAADAERRGHAVHPVDVPALTLADICRDLPFDTTHFLKIDVEGGERDVLRGADFSTFRPWIIVIEATRPNSTERTDSAWRALLEDAGYECTLFDGLNLYFVAREHSHLRDTLSAPASVHDGFVQARLKRAEDAEARLLEHVSGLDKSVARREAAMAAQAAGFAASKERLRALQRECTVLKTESKHLNAELRKVREEMKLKLDAMHESLSWRITKPLRTAKELSSSSVLKIKIVTKGAILSGLAWLNDYPRAKAQVLKLIRYVPGLERRLFVSTQARDYGEGVTHDRNRAGPSYGFARRDEQLTHWILSELAKRRRSAL